MAHVERPTFTQAVPAAAVIRTEKGKRYACWTDRKGAAVKALVLPNGRCRRTAAGRWRGCYRDRHGDKAYTPAVGDRSAALAAALDAERKARAVREGRAAPDAAAGRVRLADHLPDYLAHLAARRLTAEHRAEVRRIVGGVIERHRLTTAAAVDGAGLNARLEEDRLAGDPRRPDAGPYALKTRNHWVTALKAFGRWLEETDRADANPFRRLKLVNSDKELRRVRRALPVTSLRRLIARTARSGVTVLHTPPGDRAALYLLAASTGLRRAALFALTPESFTWAGGRPAAVHSAGGAQKAGADHGIPLADYPAGELAGWLAGKPAGVPLFRSPPRSRPRTARMLRYDLTAAGLPHRTPAGRVFDFHALRLSFGVMLAKAGVPLVMAQQLMQHSTPALTANVYSLVGGELAGEVAKLPPLGAKLGAESVHPCPPKRTPLNGRTPKGTKKPLKSAGE